MGRRQHHKSALAPAPGARQRDVPDHDDGARLSRRRWRTARRQQLAAHLASIPAAGTLVEGLPSRTFWVFVSGGREQTAASTAAIAVDDAGLAPFAVIVPPRPVLQCLVPSVVHLTLTRAKKALLQAHCRTGTVRAVHYSPRHRALHVIRQSAMARTVHVAGRGEFLLRDTGGSGPVVLLLHGWLVSADLNWCGAYGEHGRLRVRCDR